MATINSIPDLQQALERMVEDLQVEILERVKRRTPEDTGKARNGWTTEKTASGFRVSNEVDYIGYLEEGTAHTQPHNMVRTTMAEVDDIIKKSLQ